MALQYGCGHPKPGLTHYTTMFVALFSDRLLYPFLALMLPFPLPTAPCATPSCPLQVSPQHVIPLHLPSSPDPPKAQWLGWELELPRPSSWHRERLLWTMTTSVPLAPRSLCEGKVCSSYTAVSRRPEDTVASRMGRFGGFSVSYNMPDVLDVNRLEER